MTPYDMQLIEAMSAECSDGSLTTTARGRAFEKLFAHLLSAVPSVVLQLDTVNFAKSDEIDIAVAHNPFRSGLGCLPSLFLVEAKNWHAPVDSPSIAVFIDKLRDRHVDLGILVATNGGDRRPAGSSSRVPEGEFSSDLRHPAHTRHFG